MDKKTYTINDDVQTLMQAYEDEFDDCFPTFAVANDMESIKKAICQCLKEGKPYDGGLPDDAVI